MYDTQFSASKLSFILVLAINKEVVKAEVVFLEVYSICLYNSLFSYNYNT